VTTEHEESSEGFDEGRELCDDGNCLGVIVDGVCNVCGAAADGTVRERSPGAPDRARADEGDARAAHGHDGSPASDGAFDEDRQLCPDGACTGLLGSDGKCKECGRSAAS
jgi:hypothetical protein